MDKNALMENRRETIIGLLKNMKIKEGSEGGFDKDDVYDCMQQLYDLYEKHIAELESSYEAEIHDLTKRYQKYDENNELYVSLIMEAKKSSNEIINQAKNEVDEILTKGKKEIADQEAAIAKIHEDNRVEENRLAESLRTARDVMEAEKAAMRMEVEAEREKLEAMKIKYRQQISAMDGMFEEIKTNVLRTAGQLDGLKSQVEEVVPEEINWELSGTEDKAVDVQFPEADIEVEDVVEVPAEAAELRSSEDIFADTFFKSEILNQAPKAEAEPAAEIYAEPAAEPVLEIPPVEVDTPSAEEILAELESPAAAFPELEAETPAVEAPAAAMTAETPESLDRELPKAEEEVLSVEELLDDITFDDLLSDLEDEGESFKDMAETEEIPAVTEAADEAAEAVETVESDVEEISLDDLVDVVDENEDAVEAEAEKPVAEEIPFKALEALFKE